MRSAILVALISAMSGPIFAQDASDDDDYPLPEYHEFGQPASPEVPTAISDVLTRFNKAWAAEDVEGLLGIYDADVEWTNAYGVVRRGHEELGRFLKELFDHFDSAVAAEESSSRRRLSTRYLGSDVVIVHNFTESRRTPSRSGDGSRGIHSTFVLRKAADGWRIVYHMIMDARL